MKKINSIKNSSRFLVLISIITFSCVLAQTKPKVDSLKKEVDTKLVEVVKEPVEDSVATIIPKKANLKLFKENGIASYYADKFHNRKTASGAKFDNNKLTAAHKKLPFGTKLKVTNINNKKSVVVIVNDRGPFVKGREIDLSKKAFLSIANNLNSGILKVNIEIIEK